MPGEYCLQRGSGSALASQHGEEKEENLYDWEDNVEAILDQSGAKITLVD